MPSSIFAAYSRKFGGGGSPALPTTNLTAHFDASVNTHVMKTGSTAAVDGDNVEEWEDQDARDLSFWWSGASSQGPTYKTATPLMLNNCLDFASAASEKLFMFNSAGAAQKNESHIFPSGNKTIIVAVYPVSVSSNNGTVYNNEAIITTDWTGLFLKNNGGTYSINAYNWDTGADSVSINIAGVGQSYVFTYRHDGSTLYLSVNGGSESSVASGATGGTGQFSIAGGHSAAQANLRIGEIAMYDAALTGSALSDANQYFTDKW